MSIVDHLLEDDDSYNEWGICPKFGGGQYEDDYQSKKERAKEIASGLCSGLFERDEEVWELVRQLQEK